VSLITLGVDDVAVARTFYERLGWRVGLDLEETVFFQIGGSILTLWGREKLATDSGVADGGGWGGVTLAHNVGSRAEVDRVLEQARSAGARITREPAETFYGGYAGVFLDPDGHPWEVAHNPHWTVTEDGGVRI
jgi:catechol 2,3-dioxygenase-like lactoylglutathione lyase family enzyme